MHTTQSDVYSFGVFLIELVSGREARADQSVVQLVRPLFCHNSSLYVTKRMIQLELLQMTFLFPDTKVS
jgi:hypothetical protein